MLNELNSLINIRNFLNTSINDLSINMTSEKSNAISKKIVILNKNILDMALSLNVEQIVAKAHDDASTINSTFEIKTIEELDRVANFNRVIGPAVKIKSKLKQPKLDEATK